MAGLDDQQQQPKKESTPAEKRKETIAVIAVIVIFTALVFSPVLGVQWFCAIAGALLILLGISYIGNLVRWCSCGFDDVMVILLLLYLGAVLFGYSVGFIMSPAIRQRDTIQDAVSFTVLLMFGGGLLTLGHTIISLIRNYVLCTEIVQAVGVDEQTSYMHTAHRPARSTGSRRSRNHGTAVVSKAIFEYSYQGEYFQGQDDVSSNVDLLHPGESCMIRINPKQPEVYYRPRPRVTLIKIVLSGFALFMSILVYQVVL